MRALQIIVHAPVGRYSIRAEIEFMQIAYRAQFSQQPVHNRKANHAAVCVCVHLRLLIQSASLYAQSNSQTILELAGSCCD